MNQMDFLFQTRNSNDLQDKIDMVIENSQLRERIIDKGFIFVNKYESYYSHFDKFEKMIILIRKISEDFRNVITLNAEKYILRAVKV